MNKSENAFAEDKSNMGLPIDFTPGLFKRLLGFSVFSVDSDGLIIRKQKTEKICYEEITEISAITGQIKIKTGNGTETTLKTGKDNADIVRLIKKICHERELLSSFFSENAADLTYCMEFFARSFDFAADTYVNAVNILIETARRHGFSDLHLEPCAGGCLRMSWRIAAEISRGGIIPPPHAARIAARLKYLAGCLSHIGDKPQEGAFSVVGASIRLAAFPTDAGERISLRFINAARFSDLKSLGWPRELAEDWKSRIMSAKGLYVICGAVGSGKTTAMYATLSELAASCSGLRVLTIEDPVEAYIDAICQASLDLMKEGDLAAAFKHLLRQDPDIMALGEIRDSACIKEALQAGLSGHIVLATFHAGSADEAIDRIRQMGVEDYLVLSGLKGILHLDLVKDGDMMKPVVKFIKK